MDARIPESSRNPDLDRLCAGKPRILLLNKQDLADEALTREWVASFQKTDVAALPLDCRSGRGLARFMPAVRGLLKEKLERNAAKGMKGRPLRVMVAGIPNAGKSSFINRMAGAKRAKAENRPGVTRGRQWISLGAGIEMLDTPGILWPKFEDPAVGEKLAFTGAVKDDVLDREQLAARLLETVRARYAAPLAARYRLTPEELLQAGDGYALLELIGRRRGMLISGGEVDLERAAALALDEFRAGRWGGITLDLPPSPALHQPETGGE